MNPKKNPSESQNRTLKQKNESENRKNEVMRVGAPLASSLTAPSDCTDLHATNVAWVLGTSTQPHFMLRKILLFFSGRKKNKRRTFLPIFTLAPYSFFFCRPKEISRWSSCFFILHSSHFLVFRRKVIWSTRNFTPQNSFRTKKGMGNTIVNKFCNANN